MIQSTSIAFNRPQWAALGWAAFVACSWTWCIGMYLPVLLVRDFGVAGWFVFAIPNIIGAAALGWVLPTEASAASLARRHWHAAAAFSIVTILFHAFFVGWIVRGLIGDAAEIIAVTAAVGFFFLGRHGRRNPAIAAILLAFSTIAFFVAVFLSVHAIPGPSTVRGMRGLVWLAPICVLGFLLNPYLDLTFLRARASNTRIAAIAAFTLGFGLMFLVMILFTLWYARLLQPDRLMLVPPVLAWLIAGHMLLQTAFTTALHARALSEDSRARSPALLAAFAATLILAFLAGAWGGHLDAAGHSSGEFTYRLFMAFYGLIFPAYVWLCVVPVPGGRSGPTRLKLVVLAATVLIAEPMFWLGFINDRMVWLLPGFALVLASRFVAGWLARVNRASINSNPN